MEDEHRTTHLSDRAEVVQPQTNEEAWEDPVVSRCHLACTGERRLENQAGDVMRRRDVRGSRAAERAAVCVDTRPIDPGPCSQGVVGEVGSLV